MNACGKFFLDGIKRFRKPFFPGREAHQLPVIKVKILLTHMRSYFFALEGTDASPMMAFFSSFLWTSLSPVFISFYRAELFSRAQARVCGPRGLF